MILALVLLYLIGGFLYIALVAVLLAVLLVAVVLYGSAFLARLTYAKAFSHASPTWTMHRPTPPKFQIWVERFKKNGPLTLSWIVGLSVPAYFLIYMNTH